MTLQSRELELDPTLFRYLFFVQKELNEELERLRSQHSDLGSQKQEASKEIDDLKGKNAKLEE